jgi:hypothetical protein
MAYVKRAVMTQRIVDILVEFGSEGYTKTENGEITYCLNKKYVIFIEQLAADITIFAQMIKEERALGRFLRIGGKRLGNISDVWSIINMIKIANESYEVGIDQVMELIL